MTLIVGALCRDGVVIGADSAATMVQNGYHTIRQPHEKIQIIGGELIIAGTGSVGHAQRFSAKVQKAFDKKELRHTSEGSPTDVGIQLSQIGLNDFLQTQVPQRSRPEDYGTLVAFPSRKHTPCLLELSICGFQPELKLPDLWFASMGCGASIADPTLAFLKRLVWPEKQPNVAEGILAAIWALDHCCKVNPGGVAGPFSIAVLEGNNGRHLKARKLDDLELQAHMAEVESLEEYIRDCPRKLSENGANGISTPCVSEE